MENESEYNTRNVFKNKKAFRSFLKSGKFKKSGWLTALKLLAIFVLLFLGFFEIYSENILGGLALWN